MERLCRLCSGCASSCLHAGSYLLLGEAALLGYILSLHVFLRALLSLCSTFSPCPHVISVAQICDLRKD